jgi:type IV pilus assembly protein PilC
MDFTYKAKDNLGKPQTGTIQASSQKQAVDTLHKRGLFVLTLDATSQGKISGLSLSSLRKKVSLKDKIIFTNQLAMMVKGGLPLVEALKALEEQTENETFRQTIHQITADVQGGLALSKALEKHPRVFPRLYVAVAASGEQSGKLDQVLERLADQLQKDYDLMAKVKAAVTYPVVIVCALVGVLVLMLIFVVPQLKKIFDEMGVSLPLPTRILLGTSSLIVNYWYIVIVVLIGLFFGIRYWSKTAKGGYVIDNFKIKVPIFGVLVKKIYMARFTRTTGTLVAAGLPMLNILATVKEVVGNKVYQPVFSQISQEVENGATLSNALRKHKTIFPPMVFQMVAVGEKSGKVDEVLFHLAEFYDKEVEATTSNLAALIEPILILIIGAGIGVAIASVILPIYSLVNVI